MIKRCFYDLTEFKHNKDENPTVYFGLYEFNEESGFTEGAIGEMCMEWENLSTNSTKSKLVPRLKCFDDGWATLVTFSDLLNELAQYDDQCISKEKFIEILFKCNFINSPIEQ